MKVLNAHDCLTGSDQPCEMCCEHWDKDNGHCLDCGKDCTEDMMAQAYDRAKAARQDGY